MWLSDFRALRPEPESFSCDWQLHHTNRNRRKKGAVSCNAGKIRERNDSSRHFSGVIGYFRSRGLTDPLSMIQTATAENRQREWSEKRRRFLQSRKKIGSEMTAPVILGAIGYFRSRGLTDPQSTLRTKRSGN
ncbi:hypothetical protein CEXT_651021 [Caerostris extrusa]|uniref:Uncharacterized protein n=1 Tax=Caerostris extrusa TaxID=172846 RepID=A0AAV4Y3W9_CAEEX|nr:hypothetical protein CEXT_651021 [Caerostris extrusa]